jgi:hypothetical protein
MEISSQTTALVTDANGGIGQANRARARRGGREARALDHSPARKWLYSNAN